MNNSKLLRIAFSTSHLFRRLMLSAVFALSLLSVFSQEGVVHTDEYITIKPGSNLYILGSYESKNTVALPVINQSFFHLQGDLIHNGTNNMFGATPNQGTLRFFGAPTTNALITGGSAINLKNLTIDLTQNISSNGNVLLRIDGFTSFGDVKFLNGGFDVDTNTLTLFHDGTSIGLGIIAQSNEARAYTINPNIDGKISLVNFPLSSNTNYPNIKGMGLGMFLVDPVGASTILHRTFDVKQVGDTNSITRVFKLEGSANASVYKNASIKFLSTSELGTNPSDTLKMFVSTDEGQTWRQNSNNIGDIDSVYSSDSRVFMQTPSYSMLTLATPCTSPIDSINQIITTISPNDTLYNVSQAIVCDTSNISARLYASGEMGAYFEWRLSSSSTYVPQSPTGYFEATQLGTYWVRSTNIRGCMDSTSIIVDTVPSGNSNFTATPNAVCIGTSIAFSPDEVLLPGYSYAWNFGDGDTASTYNASHTYSAIGNYNVTLTVTTSQNCLSSETSVVTIKALPTVLFSAGSICPGSVLNFDNNTSVSGYTGTVDLVWDFDDATSTTSQGNQSGVGGDVTHVFASEGIYNVTLVATANGCTDSATQPIIVHPMPVSSFTTVNTCAGQNITFNNTSSISDLSSLTYYWDFTGVGPNSNTVNPVYNYATSGTYNVTLISTSINGCKDTLVQPVIVTENPLVNFTVNNECVNTPAYFGDLTTLGAQPYTYSWAFGDGNFGSVANETNTYALAGTYNVTLTVTSNDGCIGAQTIPITIYPGPNASFSASDACVGSSITAFNTSSNYVNNVWYVDGFYVGNTQNISTSFTTATVHNIQLSVESANGCVDSISNPITIHPLPVIGITSHSTCTATDLLDANPNNEVGNTYFWGTGDVTSTFLVTYNGTFTVAATSPFGCVSQDTATVTLNAAVIPELGYPDTTYCDSAFLDCGYQNAISYLWDTGETTQTITAYTSGFYGVTVVDQNGCSGYNNVEIVVLSGAPVNLGSDITSCSNDLVTLDAGPASSHLWSDGSTGQTLDVLVDGSYWVINTTGAGCISRDTIIVNIEQSPVFNLGPDFSACNSAPLNGFYNSNSSYLWNTSDITSNIIVTSSGTYILSVIDNINSCESIDTVVVTINPLPLVDLGNDTSICSYSSIVLDPGTVLPSTYVWNSGPTTSTINVATTGNYVVTVTDIATGCVNNDNINVTVLPVFTVDLGPDRQFCPGSTVVLDLGLATSGNNYLWEDETGVLANTTTYIVQDTGMHYVTVTNSFGCIANDSINILPSNISLYAVYLADSEIELGESVTFVNLSYPRPYTSEWYVENVFITNDSTPTITFNQPSIQAPSDTLMVKLIVNNGSCISERVKPIIINTPFTPPPGEVVAPPNLDNSLYSAFNVINLYPNPNNGNFNFYVDVTTETTAEINIFNVTGSLLYKEKRTVQKDNIQYNFNGWSPGIYFFQVRVFNETKTLKFIITQY